jgi:hypothetical protein
MIPWGLSALPAPNCARRELGNQDEQKLDVTHVSLLVGADANPFVLNKPNAHP